MDLRSIRRTLLLAPILSLAVIAAGCGGSSSSSGNAPTTSTSTSTASTTTAIESRTSSVLSASAALAAAIGAALHQEREAAATYQNVITRLGAVGPFSNVAASEKQHVEALERLAREHGIALRSPEASGEAAPATLHEACENAVKVERDVISLYGELLPKVAAYPTATRVLENLRRASLESHLPAFLRCAAGRQR